MGFFSWKTQDTNKSISNTYSSRGTFLVCMHDNKGNIWTEAEYAGYGVFGGKDFYELVAEMNGLKTRMEGIDLFHSNQPFLSPNLTEETAWTWTAEAPERCEFQGYFYDDEDEEVEDMLEPIDFEDDPAFDHIRDEELKFIAEEQERERNRNGEW